MDTLSLTPSVHLSVRPSPPLSSSLPPSLPYEQLFALLLPVLPSLSQPLSPSLPPSLAVVSKKAALALESYGIFSPTRWLSKELLIIFGLQNV